MNYNFSTLSPDDFEEPTRDLVGRALAIWLNVYLTYNAAIRIGS